MCAKMNWMELAAHLFEHLEPGKYISVYTMRDSVKKALANDQPLVPQPDDYGRFDFFMLPQDSHLVILCNHSYGGTPFYHTITDVFGLKEFRQKLLTFLAENNAADTVATMEPADLLESGKSEWEELVKNARSVEVAQLASYLVEDAPFGHVTNFIRQVGGHSTEFSVLKLAIGIDRKLLFFPDKGDKAPFLYSLNFPDEGTASHLEESLVEYFGNYNEIFVSSQVEKHISQKEKLEAIEDMDVEGFTDYIRENFNISVEALRLVENILNHAADTFGDPNEQRSFIRAMFDGTGVTLSDEELNRVHF